VLSQIGADTRFRFLPEALHRTFANVGGLESVARVVNSSSLIQ
jgi:hypothetical protein